MPSAEWRVLSAECRVATVQDCELRPFMLHQEQHASPLAQALPGNVD